MSGSMMQMLGGFSILRMSSMVGMANITITKEELLKVNSQLNKVKKPTK
jgi:beta-galactosidase